jgi:CheY-like chemotaxis protein
MILIVDDSATNLVLLEVILQEEGYQTVTASGVKEAFHIMERTKPELILLDLLMPEISGFDFLKEAKKNIEISSIPIFIVSAVGSKENQDKCFDLGAAYFFSKPIEIPLLLEKVKQYVV